MNGNKIIGGGAMARCAPGATPPADNHGGRRRVGDFRWDF